MCIAISDADLLESIPCSTVAGQHAVTCVMDRHETLQYSFRKSLFVWVIVCTYAVSYADKPVPAASGAPALAPAFGPAFAPAPGPSVASAPMSEPAPASGGLRAPTY